MRAAALAVFLLLAQLQAPVAAELSLPALPGWKRSAIQTFLPKTLYEHINGAADLYLASDFEELRVAEYENDEKMSVVVEAYRHRTARDAFGIYSQERPAEGEYLPVGTEGYVDRYLLNFVTGSHYVKISSHNTGPGDREILLRFANAIAGGAGRDSGLPPLLSVFPAEGKKPRSEKYITRNFLGYPFLHSAFTAEYESGGRLFRLFVIETAGTREAAEICRRYRSEVGGAGQAGDEGLYRLSDPHHGVVDLYRKGRFVAGVVDLPDAARRSEYIGRLREALETRQ